MNYVEELTSAVQSATENPKVFAVVSSATASLGAASATQIIGGALSWLAIIAGIVATMLLGRVHWISYKNQVLQNKIFREQLRELGGDPDKDD